MGRTHHAPAGMSLWLGAVDRLDPLKSQAHSLTLGDGTSGYGATLSIGRLLFHCAARTVGPAPMFRVAAPVARSFTRISPDPGHSVHWPPREILTAADQPYIAEGFANLTQLVA